LGRLLGKTGDEEGAVDALRQSVDRQPDWPIGRFYLAQALLQSGDLNGAKAEAQRGLELDARSTYASLGHFVLAEVFNREGRERDALAELHKGQALER
jgi:predicted Zn-dependent protease